MDTNINVVVANNRKPISIMGANLGTQYFKAEARASILEFDKKKLEVEQGGNIDFILNRTPRRYRMTGHDVISVQVGTDGTGASKVYLNKGDEASEVSLPITGDLSKIGAVSDDAIGNALRGEKNIIFSDPKKLASLLNQYNQDEKTRLLNTITMLQKCVGQIDSAIAENNKKADNYMTEYQSSAPETIPAGGTTIVVHDAND